MRKGEKDTSFRVYGKFYPIHSNILKEEFEKNGIPVQISYTSTGLGAEISGSASVVNHKIMIRGCDFEKAKEIQKEMGIEEGG